MAIGVKYRYHGRRLFGAGVPLDVNEHVLHGDSRPHDHDFVELAFVTGGRGEHQTIHGRQPLARGDAIVLRPEAWHAYVECRALRVTNCCFGATLLKRELAWAEEHPLVGTLLMSSADAGRTHGVAVHRLPPAALRRAMALLRALRDARHDEPAADARAIGLLTQLFAEVAANVRPTRPSAAGQAAHPAVATALQVMSDRLQDDLTLDDLAAAAGLDRAYFVRLFRRHTGLPPMLYLTQLRLDRAAPLLLRTDRPVSDIAQCVGMYDANYFARKFRGRFGVSPSLYRARLRTP